MRKPLLILVVFILLSFVGKSQHHNNEIGLSLGEVRMPFVNSCGSENNGTQIQSILHSTNEDFTYLPKLYFTKKVYKRWQIRLNLAYSRQSNDIRDLVLYDYIYDPYPNSIVTDYRYQQHNTTLGAGVQFNFIERKKIRLHTALETSFTKSNSQLFIKRQAVETGVTSGRRTTDSRSYQNQATLLVGGTYFLAKKASLALEMGLTENYFAPLSRLSINYHF